MEHTTAYKTYSGFEKWKIELEMRGAMYLTIALVFGIAQSLIVMLLSIIIYPGIWFAIIKAFINLNSGALLSLPGALFALAKNMWWAYLLTFVGMYWYYPRAIQYFKQKTLENTERRFIRGSRLVEPGEIVTQIQTNGDVLGIPIATVDVKEEETENGKK